MSYVKADTANPLGFRPLSYYESAAFPLPTTTMSRPIRPALGWYGGPFPVYAQPSSMLRLNGEFVPPGSPAPASSETDGVVTYRIDPQTGHYRFFNTDIKPRGVFLVNPYRHPHHGVHSPLGVPINKGRRTRTRTRRGRGSSSLSCLSCRGGGLGASDTFTDPATGCILDTDGNLLTCPGGVNPYFDIGNRVAAITGAPPLPQAPTVSSTGGSASSLVQSIVQAFAQPPGPNMPPVAKPSISPVMLMGAGLLGLAFMSGRGKSRR